MRHALGAMLVGNILRTASLRFPDACAVVCAGTGRRFAYRTLNERCNRLANAMTARGLRKGDCVAFLCSNRVEMIETYFALAKVGVLGLPLNYRLAPGEMVDLMIETDSVGLIAEDRFAQAAAVLRARLPLRFDVTVGAAPTPVGTDYEALLSMASPDEPVADVRESDPFYFNLTSGTTGVPKCYLLTQYNASTFMPFFQALDLSAQDTVMTVFPMYGRVGFAWAAGCAMYGITNVIVDFEADTVLRLVEREKVTVMNLVPTMGAMLVEAANHRDCRLGSLRALVFAGSLLPDPIRASVTRVLCSRLYEYYGMQETSTLVVSTPADRESRPGSVGRPVLFAEVRVVDADGDDVDVGEIGEIVGRSPGTITEYFRNPARTAETFRDGWLHTGDLGRFDADGFLYIAGRIKDVIVTGGQNVHAGEVEATVLAMHEVADCAVIGLPDPLWGEAVTAVVVPVPGESVDPGAVIAWCRARLAAFKAPKRVVVRTGPLPRTPTGKVRKFVLVDECAADAEEGR